LIPKIIERDKAIITSVTRPTAPPQRVIVETAPEPVSEIYIPSNKGAEIVFENIYYEYNSATIRSEAAGELEALLNAMNQNPFLKVKLTAHTDSRGKADYNMELSRKRARSAKLYLTRRGISASRIWTDGKGESQIRNQCTNGINCTEREHRYNRRTEVRIIES